VLRVDHNGPEFQAGVPHSDYGPALLRLGRVRAHDDKESALASDLLADIGDVDRPREFLGLLIAALGFDNDGDQRVLRDRVRDHDNRVRTVLRRRDGVQAGRGESHVRPVGKLNTGHLAQQVNGKRRMLLNELQRCLVSNGEVRHDITVSDQNIYA
jgi:hypothetical protein